MDIQKNTNEKNIDLKDFLEYLGVDVIPHGKRRFRLREHDSFIITGNRFIWNSKGINGNYYGALKELYGYKHMQILEIRDKYLEDIKLGNFVPSETIINDNKRDVSRYTISKKDKTEKIENYLYDERKLDKNIIKSLLNNELIYMDISNNINFVIKDKDGNIVKEKSKNDKEYIATDIVGTNGKKFKSNTSSHYGFNLVSSRDKNVKLEKVYVFESSIDLLSYINLKNEFENKEWSDNIRLLSTSGLREDILNNYLDDNVKEIYVCYDNDEAGNNAYEKIKNKYDNIKIIREKSVSKDWNDDLKNFRNNIDIEKIKKNFKGEIDMETENKNRMSEMVNKIQETTIEKLVNNIKEGKILDENASINLLSPTNALTGNRYHNMNRLELAMYLSEKNVKDNRILTQNELKEISEEIKNNKEIEGESILLKKGTKGAKVITSNIDKETNDHKLAYYNVYSITDIVNLPESTKEKLVNTKVEKKSIEEITENLKNSINVEIRENNSDKAFYKIKDEYISIPSKDNVNSRTYLDNLIYASVQSTINETGRYNNFSREKLVAEYSKLFVESELGIDLRKSSKTFENNKEDIQKYISEIDPEKLKMEMNSIIRDSEKAAEVVIDKYRDYEKKLEANKETEKDGWESKKETDYER